MPMSITHLIISAIGIIIIIWTLKDIIGGVVWTKNPLKLFSFVSFSFESDPLWFSIIGGSGLLIGIVFSLGPIFVIECILSIVPKFAPIFGTAYLALMLAPSLIGLSLISVLSLLSYSLGEAGQSWRNSQSNLPKKLKNGK